MSLACPTRGLGVAALIFLAASTVVRADGDNFNNGSLNSNWGTEVTSGSGPALTLDTTDGNLAYTNTNASGEVFAYLPWTPPSSGDMSEVTLDVNVLAVPILAANSHVGVGLVVSLTGTDPGPVSAGGTGNNLTIDLAADSNNQSSNMFSVEDQLTTGTTAVSENSVTIGSGAASLMVQWNNDSQTFSDFYSTNGGVTWTELSSNLSPPAGWNYTPGDTLSVGILGTSHNVTVSGDNAYGDNFTAVSTPEPPAWVFLSLGMAWLFFRRRRAAMPTA